MKTKSRNLLTVILAMLCAAAVAIGIGFLLPKAEKINANAATVGNAQPEIAGIDEINLSNSVELYPKSTGFLLRDKTRDTALGSGDGHFSIVLNVPAYTEYTVSYEILSNVRINEGLSTGNYVNADAWIDRYEDATYATPKNTGFAHAALSQSTPTNDVRNSITHTFSNFIFSNDSAQPEDFKVYFNFHFEVRYKSVAARVISEVMLENYDIIATKLAVPTTSDTITMDYDGSSHAVNYEYAKVQPARNDLDNVSHQYTTGYKNVEVTVEAKDGDGNTIGASDYTFVDNGQDDTSPIGSGSITATKAGTYTVIFNLSNSAKSYGIEWVGGGTAEKKIILTINKIDPTVNPVYGEPEEVDGNPGKWYVSNDLYRDISIETTIGETPATSDTPGTISWDADQSLSAGTKNYGWTFTPTDTRNYNTKTGTKSITVESITIASIKANFNQGTAKFYTSSKLDDLKARLAVDKVYNDQSTSRLTNADYELTGNITTAGTATITVTYTSLNTEDPALEEFTDTFTVEITAVVIKSISASFDPTGDIYLSNSLDDLKQYLTVNATYNDGKTKNNISNYTITDPAALSLGTVTVTVTSDEDNTVIDTFDVEVIPDIVPVVLPLPQAKDYTYSGEELDVVGALTTLTEEDVIKYLDVTGTASARRAGEYTVKYRIKDEFLAAGNVSWDTSNLSSLEGVTVSADGKSVEFKWNILKAKVAATWDEEDCLWVPVIVGTLAETTEPNFFINTYTNSDGKQFKNREKLAGGRTYQVTATINPQYANNFELDESSQTQINSGSETYTYTPPYVPTIWEKIVAFLKANWLWFVIAAAVLILLIIIIVVAKKCHKTKEQKEEIRARKEEERRRREEERRLQQERLQAERELARAKQEAELEKLRAQAQAGMAGAGMAAMAMQQAMPTPMQQPVQQVMQQPMQQPVQYAQQQMPQSYGGGMMERIVAELAAIREENKSKTEAELANAKLLVEFERLRGDMRGYGGTPMTHMSNGVAGNAIPADVVIALIEAVKSGNPAPVNINTAPQALPQSVEESAPVTTPAVYPPDAVVTTTTTVDTTQKPLRRERDETFADVDGFYDEFNM